MAKSTCNPNRKLPKGMLRFEVIRSTIRDSVGQYCVPGDLAVLDKKTANSYLDLNFIKVALPDFDVPNDDPKPEDKQPTADDGDEDTGNGGEDEAKDDDGGAADQARADALERAKAASAARKRNREGSAGDTADSD